MAHRQRWTRRIFSSIAALVLATQACAQGSSITMVVPAGAGSAPDIMARLLGDELRVRLGQSVIIENRIGGGGIVAVNAALQSASPETLLLAQAAVVTVTPLTYRAATYNLERDMEPVAVVAETPMFFVAHPNGPRTLAEALSAVKSRPESMTMGSPSRGSIPHLSAELLMQASGGKFNMVPMGASGQALQAVVNGDTQISVDGIAPLLPLVRAGKLRALGVASASTLPGLDGLPLVKETVPDFVATGWFMLFAKKGTPPARIKALNEAVNAALKSPPMQQRLQNSATYPVGGSVSDAIAFLAREKALWASAVQRANLQPE
jgi:tripartite-type tricarboxylate transporter receptor subunit TctC